MSHELSRRELLALLGAGVVAGCSEAGPAGSRPAVRPGVVGVSSLAAPGSGPIARAAAAEAIAAALKAATGAASAPAAAAGLFSAEDTVGIKVNCLAGRDLSPRVELVEALVDLLATAGVRRERIIVFERSSRELERAGYTIRRSGAPYVCSGIDNRWDPQPSVSGAIGSCFARLVSHDCTALVSFGVVKDHDLAGVSAGLKNWYGVIHNPNKYHDSCCDPYVADVVNHPFIRGKLRLTVLDGVRAQYHGGPAFRRDTQYELGRVVVSTDPVAADAWAWQQLDAERKRQGLPSLAEAGRAPLFIATAAGYGLGEGDPAKLKEVRA